MTDHDFLSWWAAERAIPITYALEQMLDGLEERLVYHEPEDPQHCDHVTAGCQPLGTGVKALDRVLDGGLLPGTVVIIEADIPAQARALLTTVTRLIDCPRQLDTPRFNEGVEWLMTGGAGVPHALVSEGHLSESDWNRLRDSIMHLGELDLAISSMGTLNALDRLAAVGDAAVLLIDNIHRFGPSSEYLPDLRSIAQKHGMAVLVTARAHGCLSGDTPPDVTRILMKSFNLGGSASLIRVSAEHMITVEQLSVNCLTGTVASTHGS